MASVPPVVNRHVPEPFRGHLDDQTSGLATDVGRVGGRKRA